MTLENYEYTEDANTIEVRLALFYGVKSIPQYVSVEINGKPALFESIKSNTKNYQYKRVDSLGTSNFVETEFGEPNKTSMENLIKLQW